MCEPTSAMMFAATSAMAIGQAAMGASSDAQAAALKGREYNRKIAAINAEADAINKSTVFKYQMTNLQQQQIQDKAVLEDADIKRDLATAKGTGVAAAASAGIEGNSVQQLLTGFDVSTGHDLSAVYLQRDNEIAQSRAEQKGFQMDAANRKTSLRHQIPEAPQDDLGMKLLSRSLTAAFQIGGSYMQNTTKDPSAFLGRRFG